MRYYKSILNKDIVRIDNDGWLYLYNKKINSWVKYFLLDFPDRFLDGRHQTTIEITEKEAFIEIL